MTTEKETTIEPEQQVPSEAPGTQAEGQTAETQAGEEAADVRPVFIQFGVEGARHDGTADVAAAARKGLDVPVRVCAVKVI